MDRLPVEVLVMILEAVALLNATSLPGWNQKITMDMLLVSKQWYRAMRPAAYRTVRLTTKEQVHGFIETIWQKAYLRSCVEHLQLEFPIEAPATKSDTPDPHREFRCLVGNRVFKNIGLLNYASGSWLSGLILNSTWHWIAVLFPLLRNLESLDITPGYLQRGIEGMFQAFAWITEVDPQAFHHLTSLRVQTRSNPSLTYHTGYLATLLPVERLRKLSLSGLSFDRTQAAQRIFQRLSMTLRPCNIRELKLHFHSSMWDHHGLVRTLSMFVKLESFAIQVDYGTFEVAPGRYVPLINWAQSVREGLLASALTLKQLRLIHTGGSEFPNQAGQNPHFFGSFAPFERLEFLQVSLSHLLNGHPNPALEMPRNLQRLRITGLLPANVPLAFTTVSDLVALQDLKLPCWKDLEVWRTKLGWPRNQCLWWQYPQYYQHCEACANCKMASFREKCTLAGVSFSSSCEPVGNGQPLWQSGL